jgi:hypothetical protein
MALGGHIVVFQRCGVVMKAVPRTVKGVTPPPYSEQEFMRDVMAEAQRWGWATFHPHISRWSTSGWPDIVAVRPPRLLFVELKAGRNPLSALQQRWLKLLGDCPQVETYVWRPADMRTIVEILSRGKP